LKNILLWLVFLAALGIDQSTKSWATKEFLVLSEQQSGKELLNYQSRRSESTKTVSLPLVSQTHTFTLQTSYVRNPASAWGLFSKVPEGGKLPLVLVVSLFATFLFYGLIAAFGKNRLGEKDFTLLVAYNLFVAGVIGNAIDRFQFAYVVDIWRLLVLKNEVRWFASPAANAADIFVCLGVLVLCLRLPLFFRAPPEHALEDSQQV
jgi:lipoprotein signal peptidase